MPEILDLNHDAPWQEIRSTADDWEAAGKGVLLPMLHNMHLVRAFEETVLELAGEGLIHGPAQASIGQEGGAVGCKAALRQGDQIAGSHRAHHQFLAKALTHVTAAGDDPLRDDLPEPVQKLLTRTLAEIMGLEQGFCHGRGGSMHLRWAEAGIIGTNAIVGGGVPFAAGVAWSRKRQGNSDVAVAFLGDGAVHIGAVPETMNLAALWNLPICFFIENNLYAVATTVAESTRETRLSARGVGFGIPAFRVDGMDPLSVRLAAQRAITMMRSGSGPVIVEAGVYRYFHQNGPLPGSAFGYRSKEEEAAWRARDPIDRVAREMIGRGMITEDDRARMRNTAQDAMGKAVDELVEPHGNTRRVVQALWPSPSYRDEGLRGDLSEFASVRYEESETFGGTVEEAKFIDVVARVMGRRMESDPRIFVLGEDIHRLKGGTNGATRGLPERFSDRVLGTPITEQAFVGLAGGVAIDGAFRPVVEFMYPDFSLVAADQLFNQIAKARHMFGNTTSVPLVLRTKVAMGSGYGSQHSMDPAGLYAQWPGWRIVAPATPFDYVGLMNSALICEDPVLVIEHVELYGSWGPAPTDDLDYFIPLGKAKVVRPGRDFTVLAYLNMVSHAISVADELGVDAEVVDLRSLDRAGLDWDTIGASIRKTNNVVVVEQGTLTASYGAMLADELQRRFFDYLDQPVKRTHGGEGAPTVSKVLEQAAIAGPRELRATYAQLMAESGRPLAAAE